MATDEEVINTILPRMIIHVKEKIREILESAFRDSRCSYDLRLMFYGEPNVVWVPVDYPPGLERVWRYPYLVYVEIKPIGGRIQVKISEGADILESFHETWREAFDYVTEEVFKLCNGSITRAEIIYTASDVIWRRMGHDGDGAGQQVEGAEQPRDTPER